MTQIMKIWRDIQGGKFIEKQSELINVSDTLN